MIDNSDSHLTTNEKKQLKNKIAVSIYAYKRKLVRRKVGLGVAFSIVLVSSIVLYNQQKQPSLIDDYLQIATKVKADSLNAVELILSDNKKINILEDNTTISYSKTGEQVSIGANNTTTEGAVNSTTGFNTVVVPYGKRSNIELSDGTKVWLNSGSKLIYPVVFAENKREVFLEGEGIFDVSHNKNKPFYVIAKDHEIQVLGTVFNVSNYSNEGSIETTLKSGSVQINYKGDSFLRRNESVKIKPGTSAKYNKTTKQISSKTVDVSNYFSWREGLFIFKKDDLGHIVKRLSRYYNVKISVDDELLAKQTFTGSLDLKENIDQVLEAIKETTNLEYTNISPSKIIITKTENL